MSKLDIAGMQATDSCWTVAAPHEDSWVDSMNTRVKRLVAVCLLKAHRHELTNEDLRRNRITCCVRSNASIGEVDGLA